MAVPARAGRYEIEVILGQGAAVRVLLGRDPELGRQVAIQMLRDDLPLSPAVYTELSLQLRKAAHSAAVLSHPAIGAIHDFGEQTDVGVFVVAELVRGLTLRERIARGRLLRAETAALARALGSALAYAHAEGVFHGQLRPDVIWLSPTGPKVVDFGVPTGLPRAEASADNDAPGNDAPGNDAPGNDAPGNDAPGNDAPGNDAPGNDAPGREKPDEMAPEVAAGGAPSARADQYALAACLYEAFTGKPLRARTHVASPGPASASKLRPPPGVLPEIGGEAHVEAIFDCALSPDPRRRFPTCEMFGESLAVALETPQGTPPSMPISQSSIVPRATRRWQNAIAAIAVLVIFVLIGLGGERRGAADGISLRNVARAFAATFGAARPAPAPRSADAGAERPRPP